MLNLLDPLFAAFARLAVARGILFPDLMERLKTHYVDAARGMANGKVTDSRLSVLTGLQRRDIVRLRELPAREERSNHLARLVALWQTDEVYGAYKELPKSGDAPSFEDLARTVRRDVHPRTMLDTLVATGTVAMSEDGQSVRLIKTSYQPLAGSEDQLAYLAKNFGDHLSAATENVLGQDPPHFERALHYTALTEAQVEELRLDYAAAQMVLFEQLSKKAAAMKQKSGGDGAHRFRAGGYFYATDKGDA